MDSDRLKRAFERLVLYAVASGNQVDYRAYYPAKVVAQAADFTLELIPDDTRLPSLSKVPLRLGVPGVQAKVAPGSRVLLFFEGGEPSSPAASLFQSSSLLELVVTASTKVTVNAPDVRLGDGHADVVRYGDVVSLGSLLLSAAPGAPVTGVATLALSVVPPQVDNPVPTKVKA